MSPELLSKRWRSPSDLPGLPSESVCVCVCVSTHQRVSTDPGWLKMDCILEENIKSLQSLAPSSPLKHSWLMRERDRCGEGERAALENTDSLSSPL